MQNTPLMQISHPNALRKFLKVVQLKLVLGFELEPEIRLPLSAGLLCTAPHWLAFTLHVALAPLANEFQLACMWLILELFAKNNKLHQQRLKAKLGDGQTRVECYLIHSFDGNLICYLSWLVISIDFKENLSSSSSICHTHKNFDCFSASSSTTKREKFHFTSFPLAIAQVSNS